MSLTASIGGLVKQVGVGKVRESLGAICEAVPADGRLVLGGAVAGTAALAGGPAFLVAILAAGAAAQLAGVRGQQKADEEARQQLLQDICSQVMACGPDADAIAEKVAELTGNNNPMLTRLAGYEKAEIAARVAEDVRKELAPLLPEGSGLIDWADVASFLNQNNELLVSLGTLIRVEHEKTRAHTTAEAEKTRAVTEAWARALVEKAEERARLAEAKASASDARLISHLESAVEREQKIQTLTEALAGTQAQAEAGDVQAGRAIAEARESGDMGALQALLSAEADTRQARLDEDRAASLSASREAATVAGLNGDYDEAARHWRAVLELTPDDPTVLHSLAYALHFSRASEDHGAAMREMEGFLARAVELRRAEHEGDHPDIATSLNNLAFVRESLGRELEAEPMYEDALAMRQRLFEGDHPAVATSLNNLAYVRAVQDRWAEALGPSEEAVAMARRSLPEGHPHRAVMENVLAWIRKELDGG